MTSVGETLPSREVGPITVTDIVRYQGASGDFHPLHHDDAFAKAAGYPGVFAVGMLHAGYLASYCASAFGGGEVRQFRVRFREQVWPGDTLILSGTVTDASAGLVTVDVVATRQTGGVAAAATARITRPD